MDGSGRRKQDDRDGGRYTLAELTEAAGVSVRTVRYYISEGLLPPPFGAGPASHYSGAHLNRLALIGHLKGAYLPLKEIRRRLAGLGDAEVAALLAEAAAASPVAGAAGDSPDDDALGYIDRVLNPAAVGAAGRRASTSESNLVGTEDPRGGGGPASVRDRRPGAIHEAPPPWDADPDPADPTAHDPADRVRPTRLAASRLAARPTGEEEPIDHGEPWLRIRLGDEAELLVSDRLLRRRRDKVDWLVRWARKVFR